MSSSVKVGRRAVEVSKLDKVLFPADGYTKEDLISYYREIAPYLIAETKDRPMTLERFPDGIAGGRFFSKDIPRYFPEWIARSELLKSGGTVTHVVCNDAPSLVYLANQAAITQHVGLSRVDRIDHPDQVMFDLDPGGDDFGVVRKIALIVRELLEEIGLVPFVKTSGSKGLHVVAPLDRSASYDEVRPFARDFAQLLAHRHPDEITIEHRKSNRGGRLFLDWMRNAYAQTAVAPYSVRARDGAPVAMPLEWDEVRDRRLTPGRYTIADAPAHVAEVQPWAGWRRRARGLAAPRKALDALIAEG